MATKRLLELYTTLSAKILVLVLVLVPFHAFLTVWLGSIVGGYDPLRLWKEILLVFVGVVAVWAVRSDKHILHVLSKSVLVKLIFLYVLLHVALGVWALQNQTLELKALLYALVVNLRIVFVFLVAWIFALKNSILQQHWQKIIFCAAAVVVGFGLLQAAFLPADFLRHFGYNETTIPSVQFVDQKVDFPRVQSTLRGANPLGAYLLIVVVGALVVWRQRRRQIRWPALGAAAMAALFFTYSRSAYIGVAIAVLFLACYWAWRFLSWQRIAMIVVGAVVICGAIFGVLRNNDKFQNIAFHTDEHSIAERSSNADRSNALKVAAKEVIAEPVGRGPGTAGPASQYNGSVQPRISENYYLQIGQEVGWLGLGIFVAINLLILAELWRSRRRSLSLVLFASALGLVCVNMLSHAWTDDTLAYIWWGLAGATIGGKDYDEN